MRIPCPFCGSRDSAEFSYLGDASARRPDAAKSDAGTDAAMYDYVYLRENPAGAIIGTMAPAVIAGWSWSATRAPIT
jgi:heterotetrameric sarcosine oxidase delta subunit